MMTVKKFLHEDGGAVTVEYVILVAFAAVLLSAGVWALYGAMRDLFTFWAGRFGGD